MKTTDLRFDEKICHEMVGNVFNKYRCDRFEFRNSVTQIVGLYIGETVYSLTNIQEAMDYFGYKEDIGIFRMRETQESDIHSAFENVDQIDTPVQECIQRVLLVNDCQKTFRNNLQEYEMWLTQAIIFDLGGHQISFEKDYVPFSEEIEIRRGYDLVSTLSSETNFLDEWDESIRAECTREIIKIQ